MTHPVIAALMTVSPTRPEAFGLLAELMAAEEELTPEMLVLESAEIEAAETVLIELSNRSRLAIERCLKLRPVPAPVPPVGF